MNSLLGTSITGVMTPVFDASSKTDCPKPRSGPNVTLSPDMLWLFLGMSAYGGVGVFNALGGPSYDQDLLSFSETLGITIAGFVPSRNKERAQVRFSR